MTGADFKFGSIYRITTKRPMYQPMYSKDNKTLIKIYNETCVLGMYIGSQNKFNKYQQNFIFRHGFLIGMKNSKCGIFYTAWADNFNFQEVNSDV